MMDTVLNIGLNDEVMEDMLSSCSSSPDDDSRRRFLFDSYRRLLDMFGNVVCGLPHETFDERLTDMKEKRGVDYDTELTADDLRVLVEE